MDTTRIRMKIGDNEFEAEGPAETVKDQFEAFKELVSTLPAKQPTKQDAVSPQTVLEQGHDAGISLEKILHMDGRVISLTALPKDNGDAALLIMLGHKDMRNNVSVTGQEIGDGLTQSGRPVPRVDRIMEKAIAEAFVIKTGIKRSTRYRLSNQGLQKALEIARDLIATVP